MRQLARLSSAVPHSTAFLPPAFIATLPPMHDASAEVGSQAKTRPCASAASIARLVTTPAPQRTSVTGLATPGKRRVFDQFPRVELFGIDHRRKLRQRNRAARVAGAAAARNDREPEFDARRDDAGDFFLRVRIDDDERIFDAPVGCIGHVRYARESVELDVVAARDARQAADDLASQREHLVEFLLERVDRRVRGL